MVRHFLLTVAVPRRRASCSDGSSTATSLTRRRSPPPKMARGVRAGTRGQLTDSPRRKPDYCLKMGITWQGLIALEIKDRVPPISFKSFGAFVAGAAERAKLVGDTGAGGPQNWIGIFLGGGAITS